MYGEQCGESVNVNIKVKKVNDNISTAMHMDHEI